MITRETVLRARQALLNGSGELSYFEGRGIRVETVKAAWIGYDADWGAFTYPAIAKGGGLLGIHYKSKTRDAKGKRRQWWGAYAEDLPPKGHGRKPNDLAKVIPFGMETLEGLRPGAQVILSCGEEDALSGRQAGYTSVSQAGAGLLEPAYARAFAGLEVVVFYDAGEEKAARKDAQTLRRAGAATVRVVEWLAGAPNGADVNSRLVEDPEGFDEWFDGMIEGAKPLASAQAQKTSREGKRDRYDVEEKSKESEAPEGADLLEQLAAYVRRYVVLSNEQADVLALWVVHTYALDAADTTAYLEITSVEKRSGKTRLLEVLDTVAARAWLTGRVTAAVLVRKVADLTPTLLLDESDAAFKGDKEYAEALRGILNAGFRRGGAASLCVWQGAGLTYKDFPVFGPKAIAGIGSLPDTISDRAIKIELRRRTRSEQVARFRLRKVEPEAAPLRVGAARWAKAHAAHLEALEPELPEELDDRAQEICEPLLAIASEAGGDWPGRARKAIIALAGAPAREDTESLGTRLLRDIRGVFNEKGAERLPTGDLLEALCATDEAPWGSLRGEALDARGLARFLKPYKIGPEKLRDGEKTFRGYRRASFEDAWARYAPDPREEAEHLEHLEQSANRADSHVPHNKDVPERAAYVEHQRSHKKADVPGVPDVPDNLGERDGTLCSEAAELLANPPEWLRRQVEKHLEDPREGTLKALCASVAHELLGNPRRGEEIRPAVEQALEEWRVHET